MSPTLAGEFFTTSTPVMTVSDYNRFLLLILFNLYFKLECKISNVLISGGQQSDSLVRIHAFLLCEVLFPYRLFQNIAQSSLYYTVGPCWSSILNIVICIYSTPKLLLYVLLPTSFVR